MKKRNLINRIQLLLILLSVTSFTRAQLYSPGRSWADTTQYTGASAVQDSIFVFFSSADSPKKGNLKAISPYASPSEFIWFKYNDAIANPANRFQEISRETVDVSLKNDLDRGGYKVSIIKGTDTSNYYCWLMIDEVTIDTIAIDSRCDFLELSTITKPSTISIKNDNIFSYWDIKTKASYHPEIDKLGNDYFKDIVWHASSSQITIPTDPSLTLSIANPAPLYDSKYDIRIQNPFGRIFTSETDLLLAKASKADFSVFVDKDGAWSDGGSTPSGEALLELKLESKSINCDSIYWHIINDEKLFKQNGDSIVWRDSSLFTERVESYPLKEKMLPGKFPVKHIAVKLSSGCRDTMTIYVEVDTSAIKPDAIPNVFSPNGDNKNEYFKIKEAQTNITSIKTFNVFIINRQGYRVYKYSGNAKEWEGWNGKIDGNKANAPEGIYYYIIEAVGWDNKSYKGGVYKGFVYLLRGR